MSPADKNIAIFSEQKSLPRFFAKRRKIFCFYFIKCWKVCNEKLLLYMYEPYEWLTTLKKVFEFNVGKNQVLN